MQAISYAVPLVAMPYLVRTVSPEGFGALIFAQALVRYFCMLAEYGFPLSAPSEIAVAALQRDRLVELASQILGAKLILAAASLALLLTAVAAVPRLREDWALHAAAGLGILAVGVSPAWLLQGMERMYVLAAAGIGGQIASLALLVVLVEDPGDLVLASAILASPGLFAAALGWPVLARQLGGRALWPNFCGLRTILGRGWPLFTSSMGIQIYVNSNVFVVGMMVGPAAAGIYGAAERLARALAAAFYPLVNALYPRVSRLAAHEPARARLLLIKASRPALGAAVTAGVLMCAFSEQMVALLFDNKMQKTASILCILSPVPALIVASQFLGVLVLIPFGWRSQFARVTLQAAVVGLAVIFPAVMLADVYGAAGAHVIVEAYVVVAMVWVLRAHGWWRVMRR